MQREQPGRQPTAGGTCACSGAQEARHEQALAGRPDARPLQSPPAGRTSPSHAPATRLAARPHPPTKQVISLDAVKCEALSPVSLGYYLDFVYSGALPAFETVRCPPACMAACLPACLPAFPRPRLPACLPARLPTPPPACLPAWRRTAGGGQGGGPVGRAGRRAAPQQGPRGPLARPNSTPFPAALPPRQAADAVELLRLSAFFSNSALSSQLAAHLGAQLGAMPEEAVLEVRRPAASRPGPSARGAAACSAARASSPPGRMRPAALPGCSFPIATREPPAVPALPQVFRAAVDLQQRRLVTECLVLLLPQFGRRASDATVAQVIELMDATLSKVVLTQVRAA